MRFLTTWMIHGLIGVVTICSTASFSHAENLPRRVVSANLCTDQLLLALADPDQIVSLSRFARDPSMSYLYEQAARFPQNRGNAEDLVKIDADLALVGSYDAGYTRELLKKRGLAFLPVPPWGSHQEGLDQIRRVSKAVGHAERGEVMIARIEGALARLREQVAPRKSRPSALIVSRRGFVYHAGPMAEIIAAAGLTDLAVQIGLAPSGYVTMEQLISLRPDYLIVSEREFSPKDQGQAFLAHPALVDLWPPERRLVAPGHLTICGGPSVIELIDTMAAEIAAKVR
jgi:iron complex transport system substrate-binding protein